MLKNRRVTGWLVLAGIIVVGLYISFIIIQNATEEDLKISMLKQQILQQKAQTDNLASQVETDLLAIIKNLETVASLDDAKKGDFSSDIFLEQLRKTYQNLNERTEISSLTILDNNGFVVNDIDENDEGSSIGLDLSFREYAIQTKYTQLPYFSNGFSSFLTGKQAIVITAPIIDDSDVYRGLDLAYLPTIPFFNHYASITNIDAQSIIISDRENRIIFHPDESLIGQDISVIKTNENDISQIPVQYISSDLKEILTTSTITFNQNPTYYIHVFTSTEIIFSQAIDILNSQKIILLTLVTAISIILGLLILYMKKFYLAEQSRFMVIGEMSARFAHDIRNPLSVIRNTMENLKTMYETDDKKQASFDRVERAIMRIAHQVDDVLDFVKERPLRLDRTKMSDVISESLDSITIPSNIKLILPENDVEVICDKKQLAVALNNLILNGIQAIDGEGTIEISVEENNDEIIIQVEDSGKAIPKEELNTIFEPLFTTKQYGTGLGLASVKSIIKSHKGTISVTSPPTIFTITLPKTSESNNFQ